MASSDFPSWLEDIQADPRCSYDTVANVWILEAQDECYEWNAGNRSWTVQVNPIDQPLEEDDLEAATNDSKKRKAEDEPENKPKVKKQQEKKPRQPKQNSAIWVTNLPLDATFEEIEEKFTRWGGMIAKSIDTGKPRIKMYEDDEGNFKGEALITFFQPASVSQTIELADDRAFRDIGNDKISVEEASMDYKKTKEPTSTEPKEDTRSKKDKAKAKRAHEEQMARLTEWSDDDVQAAKPATPAENKYANTIIVRNMFTLEQLEREKVVRKAADAAGQRPEDSVLDEIPENLHDMNEAKKWGRIAAIDVFDAEPDGVVRIRFDTVEAATKCAKGLPAIRFDGRNLDVEVASRNYRFKKAPRDDDDEDIRLKWFGKDATAGNIKRE